jgi:hypothetical protein
MSDMDDILDKLKRINRVETPPFLFTRIEGRILNMHKAPVQWKWAFAISSLIVLIMNIFIVIKPVERGENSGIEMVISEMHLSNSNTLYDE